MEMSFFLTSAMGIAISPMPIIAMIIFCVTGRAKIQGTAFGLGAFAGILGVMILTVFLGQKAGASTESGPSFWAIALQFAFAFLLLALAWRNWKTRPDPHAEPAEPKWIGKLSTANSLTAFLLGAALITINPKNLPIMGSVAIAIAGEASSWTTGIFQALIFTLLAILGLVIPWALSVFGGDNMNAALENMRDWLYRYNNVIMVLLFGILGIQALGKAIDMLMI